MPPVDGVKFATTLLLAFIVIVVGFADPLRSPLQFENTKPAAGDALICIGGATGALSEVALASKIGRPVFAFPASGGTAALVAKALEKVASVKTQEEAVRRLREIL